MGVGLDRVEELEKIQLWSDCIAPVYQAIVAINYQYRVRLHNFAYFKHQSFEVRMAHIVRWSHVQRVCLHLGRYFFAVSGWCRQAERQVVVGLALKWCAKQIKVSQCACINVCL